MKIGIISTSFKENEKRVPIYPAQVPWIDPDLRKSLVFESGYGLEYGYKDDYFIQNLSSIASRDDLFKECDVLINPKPVIEDYMKMHECQTLWGWHHCVQGKEITQIAIDRKLTLIAWEAMHLWSGSGDRLMHIFYKNNEIAGYSAVLHVLQFLGLDGHYGPRRNVIVIGYGSVSRGAIYALQGRGFNNINVYTRRPVHLVADQNPDVYYHHLKVTPNGQMIAVHNDGMERPFIEELAEADILCNCILQDTDNPITYVYDNDIKLLKPRSVIVDISCDEGMGFSFARPTTFSEPTFTVGSNITYYSVDHTPSYLWNAASREISKAVISYLPIIVDGYDSWMLNETLSKSIEIYNGMIQNKKIFSYQNRSMDYPYKIKEQK